MSESNSNGTDPNYKETEFGTTHPAFGLISISHVKSNQGQIMYGSELKHRDIIQIQVHSSESQRVNSFDHHMQRELLMEVNMSFTQFSQFITSPNRGSGVPCTLSYSKHSGKIPKLTNTENNSSKLKKEIRESVASSVNEIKSVQKSLEEILSSGKSIGKKEIAEINRLLKIGIDNLQPNLEYVVNEVEKNIEDVKTQAKVEIDNYISSRIPNQKEIKFIE